MAHTNWHQLWLYAEGIYCIRTKSLYGNNSGKSEPTVTKYYRKIQGHVVRSPANLWHPPPNGREMASKEMHFANVFVSKTTHHFTHFPAVDFREIWNVNTKRDSVWLWKLSEQNFEIFPKRGVIFPRKKFILKVLGVNFRRARLSLGLLPTANLSIASIGIL